MSETFDVAVVGAGPAGMAAAATAAETGARVCLIDDNASPGGQIWRGGVAQRQMNPALAAWMRRIERGRVILRSGYRVVDAPTSTNLRIEHEGQSSDIRYSALILATGARELFLPFPGWTLPGIYGAGGLQAFVKSGLDIRGKRVVVAGTGPLLLAVSASLRRSGANLVAIVEQAPLLRLAKFSVGLLHRPSKLAEGVSYGFRTLGILYKTGSWVTNASGDGHLCSVTISSGAASLEIEADMLAIGFHLIPNTELAELLGCDLASGLVHVDALQRTSVDRIYCAGESTGIGGVDKAQIEGQIAALAACGKTAQAKALIPSRDRQIRFVHSLVKAFELRDELRSLAANETIVCRCEDVTHGAISACRSWREAKLHTRCGMGPCQGRICGPAAQFLYGWGVPSPRPPLFPVHTATLVEVRPENQAPAPSD